MLKKAGFLTRDTCVIKRKTYAHAKPAEASSSQNGRPNSAEPMMLPFRTRAT